MIWLGFDPGTKGAFAGLDDYGDLLFTERVPVVVITSGKKRQSVIDAGAFRNLLDKVVAGQQCFAVVEDVHAMPQQGSVSTFRFGEAKGIIIGLLAGLGIGYRLVAPQTWKKKFGFGADKGKILLEAKRRYPKMSISSEDEAEAVFLALYGFLTSRPDYS